MKEKVVSFRKTPQSLTLLCEVFLAAAVSQQYSTRRLTLPRKRRYAQMWGAGAGKPCLREWMNNALLA